MRMDDKDIFLPNRAQVQMDFMYRNPDVGMAGTQAAWLGPNAFDKSIKLLPIHDAIRKALRAG